MLHHADLMRAGGLGRLLFRFLTCLLRFTQSREVIGASVFPLSCSSQKKHDSKPSTTSTWGCFQKGCVSESGATFAPKRVDKQCLFLGGLPLNSLLFLKVFMLLKVPQVVFVMSVSPQGFSSFIHIHLMPTMGKCLSSISKAATSFDMKDLSISHCTRQSLPCKLFM